MSAMPDVCPVCSTPFTADCRVPTAVGPRQQPEAARAVDLREPASTSHAAVDDDDAPSPEFDSGTIDLTIDESDNSSSGTATPTRTRPKTPLRPYVPATAQQTPNPFAPPTPARPDRDSLTELRSRSPDRIHCRPSPAHRRTNRALRRRGRTTPLHRPTCRPRARRPCPARRAGAESALAVRATCTAGATAAGPARGATCTNRSDPQTGPPPPSPQSPPPPPAGVPQPPTPPAGAPPGPAQAAAAPLPPRPPLAPRPDPYAQISNPLHTAWGQAPPTPAVHHLPPPTPVTHRRGSKWLGRLAKLLVLALLAGGIWWQRDWLGDQVDSLYERINGDDTSSALQDPASSPADPGCTRSPTSSRQPSEREVERRPTVRHGDAQR